MAGLQNSLGGKAADARLARSYGSGRGDPLSTTQCLFENKKNHILSPKPKILWCEQSSSAPEFLHELGVTMYLFICDF